MRGRTHLFHLFQLFVKNLCCLSNDAAARQKELLEVVMEALMKRFCFSGRRHYLITAHDGAAEDEGEDDAVLGLTVIISHVQRK